MLLDNAFVIKKIEEWISPKKSEGKMAKIEDEGRKEFPLFMAIEAIKYEWKIFGKFGNHRESDSLGGFFGDKQPNRIEEK